jgi:hypothetical protein
MAALERFFGVIFGILWGMSTHGAAEAVNNPSGSEDLVEKSLRTFVEFQKNLGGQNWQIGGACGEKL